MTLNHQHVLVFMVILIGYNLCYSLTLNQKPHDPDYIDTDDDNNANLFYADDDILSTEKTPLTQELSMRQLMHEVLKNGNDSNPNDQCQQYKDLIHDLCIARFREKSRIRYDFKKNKYDKDDKDDKDDEDYDSIAPAQQVCCEFKNTYLQCLVSNINAICPPRAFNDLYEQVEGLAKICSQFFEKSTRKCRRHYTIMASGGLHFQNIVPQELNNNHNIKP